MSGSQEQEPVLEEMQREEQGLRVEPVRMKALVHWAQEHGRVRRQGLIQNRALLQKARG